MSFDQLAKPHTHTQTDTCPVRTEEDRESLLNEEVG